MYYPFAMKYLLYFMWALSLVSCVDEIDLKVPGEERDSIVIDGKFFVQGDGWVEVFIQQLFDFTASSRSAIDIKRVELWDASGNIVQLERQTYARFSKHIPADIEGFDLTPGDPYVLKVFTAEGDYYSDPVILHGLPDGIVFSWQPDTLGSNRAVKYYMEIDNINDWKNKYLIRYNLERAYKFSDYINQECYVIKKSVYNTNNYYDLNNLNKTGIDRLEIYSQNITNQLAEDHYMNVIVESLDANAFRYFEIIESLKKNNKSIYDDAVGLVPSNMNKVGGEELDALGLFYATSVDTMRIRIKGEDLNFPKKACSDFDVDCRVSNVPCCDCLIIDYSTLTPPDYWE